MKEIITLSLLLLSASCLWGQMPEGPKPSYCNEPPNAYEKRPKAISGGLPRFATKAVVEYKVQVAILRTTDPRSYPFHKALIARYRPCEQVWVVESRQMFKRRADAEKLQAELKRLGYGESYITTLIGYE